MTWLVYTLISLVTISLFYVFTKRILNDELNSPKTFAALIQITVGVICFILLLLFGDFYFDFTLKTTLIYIASGFVYAIAAGTFYTGLSQTDVSETTVLESTAIFWSMIFGVFLLGERLTSHTLIAAMIIFIAVLIVAYHKGEKLLTINKAKGLILLATAIYTLGAAIDNYLVGFSNPLCYMAMSFTFAGAIAFLLFYKDTSKNIGQMLKRKNFVIYLLIAASCTTITYLSLFTAYDLGGELSRVYPIYQLQTVLIPILGVILLKERERIPRKALALALTIFAIYFAQLG